MSLNLTYQLEVFSELKAIDSASFHDILKFYENHREVWVGLDFSDQYEADLLYSNALFKTGSYERFLRVVDEQVECSVMHNIQYYKGDDIYLKLLYQKASCLFQLGNYEESERIYFEILRLDPDNKKFIRGLQTCLLEQKPTKIRKILGWSILMYFLSVALIIASILWIDPFDMVMSDEFEMARLFAFGMGLLLMFLATFIHRFTVSRRIKQWREDARKERLSN